jgi:oligopeptide/dipeptide ABC transporter ATP-binding protein
MALSLEPEVLIADEPTTALDVTVQAQIMALLNDLKQESQLALILITHDLGVVAEVADRVAVMYAGRVVEQAPVRTLFRSPSHPYTDGLMASIPRLGRRGSRLPALGGMPPTLSSPPDGCPFHPRCAYGRPTCVAHVPPVHWVELDHGSACHFAEEVMRND